ncbi:MAG: type pilus assembly protein PilB [Frankiaceae bacterium]|nr:type pilus assembly protein PilB [Frankiaceae bacterium]
MADEIKVSPGAPTRDVRRRLGEVLVEQRAITEEQLEAALEAQREAARERRRVRLGTLVVEMGFATDRQIAAALATALSLDLVDIGTLPLQSDVTRLLPRAVAERHLVIPIARDANGRVTLACADPTNVVALDDVKIYAGITDMTVVVASASQVRDLIARVWALSGDSADVAMMLEDLDTADDEPEQGSGFADAPTVRLVNSIIADAVRARASDIHVEPQATAVRVRYRVDGLLRDVMTAPRAAAAGIVSRIKVMSNLDIAERRVPQDGRTRLQVEGAVLDARVSTLPNIHGEKVVIRLLSRADSVPPITKIGMGEKQLETLLGTLVAPQGLILICGPTGSGKTSTLYSAIHQIKTPDRNIVTLEDPVEMQVTGITQVQVHERAGLTFERGLRSVLRQDPDVVLVGEVRDPETAKLALEASLTGHLVLTTLHTNSAPAALTRLVDMGVEPFLVASSLSLVVAQRLVRRVCDSCAAPYVPPARILTLLGIDDEDLAQATPLRGAGCSDCGGTGYRSRIGVFEVLPVTAAMRAILMTNPNEGAVAAQALADGMQTLRASAIGKAHAGLTTYEEVLRVTQVDSTSGLHCSACGGALASDMVACPWCAANIDRGHCAECDRPLEAEWRVCPWCRTAAPNRPQAVTAMADGPPRVLLVEDDPSVRAYVTTALAGTIEVEAVETASEGLDKATSGSYDGVLVDHLLPDLTGVEMIRLLRSEARTAALPVMLFTGDANPDLETEARNAGADDYLAKPVEPAILEERLLALVSRSARIGTRAG